MNKILFVITAIFFTNTVSAATFEVEMLNRLGKESMVYSESVVNIQSGDTVKWLATTKGHNVQFLSVPDGVGAFRSKLNVDTEYTFTVPGIYLYQCTPHKNMGMIAVVVVDGNKDNLNAISSARVAGKSKQRLAKIIETLNS
ncbi:MAG: pseudoazurin [Rhodobiaceae bacterium]|nr:pseudoazurin [Rhodobiaceae bacterium]|tara:strand:+ start:1408 stop:1833 length:426 start_codon:yes stop_codon:yes gene_type:complete